MFRRIKMSILASLAVLMISADAGAVSFCIDPGHGGSDPGATGCGLIESQLTLNVSKQVRELLQAAGHTVYLTRETEEFVDLAPRANYANSKGVDSFASIHINSFDASSTGIETFCYTGCLASQSKGYQQAAKIQSQMLAVWSLPNRGVKEENFAVLRRTDMPATLSELAFISNCGADYGYLSSAAHLTEAARAHCKALTEQWAGGVAAACSGGSGGETPKTGKVMAGTFKNTLDDTSDANWLGGVKFTIGSLSQTSADSKSMMTFDVPVGPFTATASKDGYNTATRSDCSPASASEISWCSIALTPKAAPPAKGKLSGAVMDGANNAKIVATVALNGANIAYDGKNNWVSGDLDPKAYTVEATADGYDKGSVSCTVAANKTTDCPITLKPKKGTIQGIVFDNASNAQIAASLTLGAMQAASTATTPYEFSVDAGTYTITASAPGYDAGSKSCSVEKGKTSSCDIGLTKTAVDSPNGTATGTLTDKNSARPIKGKITIPNQPDYACDETGIYTFSLKPGTYQLTGSSPGYAPGTVNCAVISEQAAVCDIALAPLPVKVTGTVFDASTQATVAATVTINGMLLRYDGQTDWSTELLPGNYTISASAKGYKDGSASCDVVAATDNVCSIALVGEDAKVGALNGVVYNVDGGLNSKDEPLLPLVATVSVNGFKTVETTADGKWIVDNLPAASYQIRAVKEGYYNETVNCKVVAGESSYCPIGLKMKESNAGNTEPDPPEKPNHQDDSGTLDDESFPTVSFVESDGCSAAPLLGTSSQPLLLFAAALGVLAALGMRRKNPKEGKQ